jgi:hypothetical protein
MIAAVVVEAASVAVVVGQFVASLAESVIHSYPYFYKVEQGWRQDC